MLNLSPRTLGFDRLPTDSPCVMSHAHTHTSHVIMSNETAACGIQFYMGFTYFMVAIDIFIICECFVVIFIIWRTKKLHGNTNIFVASLAANDLVSAGFYMCDWIAITHFRPSAVLSSIMYVLCSATTTQSMIHMAVIAVDRYIHIVHPFYYMKHMTTNHVYIILICMWIIGLAVTVIPQAIFYKNMVFKCVFLHQQAIYISVGAAVYVATIALVCFCYCNIARVAFKHKKAAIARRSQPCGLAIDFQLRNNFHAAMRSVRFVALMFGVFTVCSLPPFVTTVMGLLITIPENIYVGFFFFVPIHSVISFLVYANMNRDFASVFLDTLRKYRC